MRTRVSEKGQVTIPKRLRDRLGIRPGQVMEFVESDGALVGRKADDRDPIDRVYGILSLDVSVDEFIDELRGPADPP